MIFEKDSINQFLEFSPNVVKVTIPVEKFTEAEISTDVRIVNNGQNKVKVFPDAVKVYYKVALKDYEKVEAGMITAVADFSEVNFGEDDKVRIKVSGYPEFIEITRIEPEKSEFIIIK